jgi:hypothetical protein
MGGVYNYVNLHVYHYAGNNPVKYTDPDGKLLTISGDEEAASQIIEKLNNYSRDQYRAVRIDDNFYAVEKTGAVNRNGSRTYSREINRTLRKDDVLVVIGLIEGGDVFSSDDSHLFDVMNSMFEDYDIPFKVSGKMDNDVIIENVISENNRSGGSFAYFRKDSFSEGLLMNELVSTIIPALNRTRGSSSRTVDRIKKELGL